ncbi:ABC transporter ATP-binding protein [Micromonospora sp. H61]|uniref:ABC transporter ATP-binding protein n=1 Tax=Micromonospora sp. H61 TaxID=2824888 RepID=UPI001B35FEAF|nr:ABC transporter ATP-binding protein [Micromonospora sp. H61]MBQ0992863.1 ABC transporter ATP-binding protein [Micromonospora sp. H61]
MTTASAPVLEIRDLSVSFPTETGTVSAVDGVSLDLAAGEIVGMVGESGCGKSVTAMSLAGLLPGSARVTGSVRLDGTQLVGARESALRRVRGREIAYIFQEPMTSLNPVLTVGRQIGEVLQVHERMSRRAARARAMELLTLVGIPSAAQRVDNYPHQLSGGMRQRVMIAMAVACGPKVLVADEPTTALDVTVQAGILQVLRDLRDRLGTSVLIITHDLSAVEYLADDIAVMYLGQLVETGSRERIFARPAHPYTQALLSAAPVADPVRQRHRQPVLLGDDLPSALDPPSGCRFRTRCPLAFDRCATEVPAQTAIGDGMAACHLVRPDGTGPDVRTADPSEVLS